MSNDDLTTSWRLLATRTLGALNVVLSIDTVAPVIVEAIEEAARKNGIALVRVEDDAAKAEPDAANAEDETADAEESRPPPIAPGSISNLVVTGLADTRDR